MKATGIVRRIDDLGRVVIPKEIRKTLRIKEGTPMEIYTDRQGEIILKKYSPIGELDIFAKEYTEALFQTTGFTVCITDRDQVVAAAGPGSRELTGKSISRELEKVIAERSTKSFNAGERKKIPITELKVNDDIVYLGNKNDFAGKIVTHQIIEIEKKGNELYFHTKGIANMIEDPLVEENQIF